MVYFEKTGGGATATKTYQVSLEKSRSREVLQIKPQRQKSAPHKGWRTAFFLKPGIFPAFSPQTPRRG
jgi:hypothetical protein